MANLVPLKYAYAANVFAADEFLYPPQYVNAYVMVGGAGATTVTVPTGAKIAIFNSTGNFYANWTAAAAVPTIDITNGAGPEINPVSRDVSGQRTFSLIAPANCIVTIAYFS
jgi:hypothetical protein